MGRARRWGYHSLDARVGFGQDQYSPAADAVAHDGDSIGIGPGNTRNRAGEHIVEQEAGVENAVGREALDIAGDLRGDDFGMIEGGDHEAVTGEVHGEAGGGATAAAAVMRIEDEGLRAGLVRAPDIAGEETVPGHVAGFEGMGTEGEWSGGEGCAAIHKRA